MPITAEAQGKTFEFPDGTTPEQMSSAIDEYFASQQTPQPIAQQAINEPLQKTVNTEERRRGIGGGDNNTSFTGGLEVAATIGTSAIAEPIAGWAGILTAPFVGADGAAENIEAVKQAMTYIPKSESGLGMLEGVSAAIDPIASTLSTVENTLGDAVLDATGSPELAAAAYSLPTAFIEALGVKGLRTSGRLDDAKLSGNVVKAMKQAAPDIEKINSAKNAAYRQLDNSGIKIQPRVYEKWANDLSAKIKKEGLDSDLHPKSTAVLNRILKDVGQAKTMSELETLRKVAQSAAQSIDKPDARLGSIIIDSIDEGMDSLAQQIGGTARKARDMASRGFKSRVISDMFESAAHTASGLENGLRIEARKILKNRKKRRGFSVDQLEALRQVEQGTTAANIAKFMGKFGISENQATSMLGFSIGAGGGGAIGAAFGGTPGAAVGAIGLPALGQIAKKTAQRITKNNAKYADDLVRAGNNGNDIVKAYLKNTPIDDRSVSDLTDLLLTTGVSVADIKNLPKSASGVNKLISDAKFFAKAVERKAKQTAGAALILSPGVNTDAGNNGDESDN